MSWRASGFLASALSVDDADELPALTNIQLYELEQPFAGVDILHDEPMGSCSLSRKIWDMTRRPAVLRCRLSAVASPREPVHTHTNYTFTYTCSSNLRSGSVLAAEASYGILEIWPCICIVHCLAIGTTFLILMFFWGSIRTTAVLQQ